jgi:hypothetical protein
MSMAPIGRPHASNSPLFPAAQSVRCSSDDGVIFYFCSAWLLHSWILNRCFEILSRKSISSYCISVISAQLGIQFLMLYQIAKVRKEQPIAASQDVLFSVSYGESRPSNLLRQRLSCAQCGLPQVIFKRRLTTQVRHSTLAKLNTFLLFRHDRYKEKR